MTLDKKLFFCLLLSTSLLSSAAHSENHLLLMGGGGEPQGDKTLFDSGMRAFAANLNGSKWKYDISFNGGHKETEEIIKSKYNQAQSVSHFTTDQFKSSIETYKAKILLGEIGPEDQLMIIINTHGAINDGGQVTHKIAAKGKAAKDLNKLSDADLVSLDELQELVKLTNERGIKLGIVDLSCHSGSTQKLKSPNTCVISATGPVHYGFAGGASFSDKFMASMARGTTMEQAYLKARRDSIDAAYPMISTEEHESIASDVYQRITPYLYFYDPKADKLTDYLMANSGDQLICQRDLHFSELIKTIEKFQRLVPQSAAEQLKKLLSEYKGQQDNILLKMRELGGHQLETKKESFITPVNGSKSRPVSWNYSWKEILNTDATALMQMFKDRAQRSKNMQEKNENLALSENYRKLKVKQEELLARYPKLKQYQTEARALAREIGQNRQVAEKIATEEKKFYDQLYSQRQGLNFNDPCRQITF